MGYNLDNPIIEIWAKESAFVTLPVVVVVVVECVLKKEY